MAVPEEAFDVVGDQANRRVDPRAKVRWWAQLEIGGDRFACNIFDISLGGAKLSIADPLPLRAPIRLLMPPFGHFTGEIAWQSGGVAGLEFSSKDHPRLAKLIDSVLANTPR